MIKEFRLPELGENITAGEVVQVHVSPGDQIKEEQVVLEIETDKATIEVPAPFAGTVKEVMIQAGKTAEVGQLLLTVESGGEPSAAAERRGPASAPVQQEPAPVNQAPATEEKAESFVTIESQPTPPPAHRMAKVEEFRLPELGENIRSGEIVAVHVQPGQQVEKEQIVIEIETDKATIEVPSPASGRIKNLMVKAGDHAEVGQLIFTLESAAAEPAKQAEPAKAAAQPAATAPAETPPRPAAAAAAPATAPAARVTAPPARSRIVPAAPSVRRFAREIGIDISQVPGTGPAGRISIEDVKRFSRDLRGQAQKGFGGAMLAPALTLPDFSKWGGISREPMSTIRKATARQMAGAWVTIPHVTQHDLADITELETLRKKFAPKATAAGGKLTVTAILLKIVAAGLKVFPKFNCSLDVENNEIIYKKYYHLGVAVDTDRGLLVPVVRDVDQKNIVQLSVELNQLAEKARNRKLSLEEMQGSTFTLTNLGGIGGTSFTPIVNWPEVAILGISRGKYEPLYSDGQFVPRLMLPLSLSYDHRIIDGADAARFLRWIVDALEQPFMIALEG